MDYSHILQYSVKNLEMYYKGYSSNIVLNESKSSQFHVNIIIRGGDSLGDSIYNKLSRYIISDYSEDEINEVSQEVQNIQSYLFKISMRDKFGQNDNII